MKCVLLGLVGLALMRGAGVVVAAETATNDVTSLVAEAVSTNPEILYYEAELTAAKAGRKTAAWLPNPELNVEVGQKRTRDTTGVAGEGVAWSVSIMQSFEWPGRLGLRKAIANSQVDLAGLGLDQFRAELAGRVRAAAWRLWSAQQRVNTAKEVQQRFSALREVLVQRDPAGITPTLEIRVIEATELTLRKKVTDAEVEAQAARTELNLLRGHPAGEKVFVESAQTEFSPVPALPELLALARTNNFALRIRAAELIQQGFRVDLARNERYPAVTVGPVYSEENSLGQDRIIGLGISVPLPLWRKNKVNVEAAEARRVQAQALLAASSREMEQAVVQGAQAYASRLSEMNHWQPSAIEEFAKAAELADRHYRVGAVPVTTYVELQKQYVEAVDSLLSLRAEAMQAARDLERSVGLDMHLVKLVPSSAEDTANKVEGQP